MNVINYLTPAGVRGSAVSAPNINRGGRRVKGGPQVRFSTTPGGEVLGMVYQARAKEQVTALEWATEYHSRGWAPTPLKAESKKPILDDFLNIVLKKDELQEKFKDPGTNVGIILGEASGGLVDVDLDTVEAVKLAAHFLPETARFGRPHSLGSHWLYIASGAGLKQFSCPGVGMVVEIRGSGGQTVFPGSLYAGEKSTGNHKGEPILWEHDVPAVVMDLADLTVRAGKLAAAAVLLHHWQAGTRDPLAVAVCGVALRAGWSAEEADDFVMVIAEAAGDEEARDRAKAWRMEGKLENGTGRVPGAPKLAEVVGKDKTDRVVEWMSLGQAIDTGETPDWVEEMNATFFVVEDGGKMAVCNEVLDEELGRTELHFRSFHTFRERYLNRSVTVWVDGKAKQAPKGSTWLTHPARRQYDQIVMSPKGERPGCYNLWRGFNVEPAKGDWSLMQEHILKNICQGDQAIYDYLLRWKAYAVQHPDWPGQVAIVLRGPRGAGKGFYISWFGGLFGRHFVHISSSQRLVGNFNNHLRDCVFLFADEACFVNDRAGEKKLNALITEKTIPIEAKGKDLITVPNRLHIMMASNDEYVAPAGTFERRYCVLDVGADRMQDTRFFGRLKKQMENGGSAAMLHDLLAVDLTDFDIWAYPRTAALADQQDNHLDLYTKFCYEFLWEGEIHGRGEDGKVLTVVLEDKPTMVGTGFMRGAFKQAMGGAKLAYETGQATQLGKAVAKLGVTKGRPRPAHGTEASPRGYCYLLPGLTEMRAAFELDQRRTVGWPVDDGTGVEGFDATLGLAGEVV